ncbi:MAG: lipid-A-disaccharide synthase [Candidatus Krumholzibacteria bacterium]|nr:lipid-A-disaccharide synthase [Candidatus Krumholzibacteria bacterium]
MTTILLTCGETSGDHHAARLAEAILDLEPQTRIVALGGPRLAAAGAEIAFDISRFNFMGFTEIVRGLPRIARLERSLGRLISGGGIDLHIPVDYPGLNLRIAARARSGGVPVLYFISPQVWAWAGWRTARMRRAIDLMAVILPFEVGYFRNAGIPVFFAGHPMASEIDPPAAPKEAPNPEQAFEVLLFPGSRRQEVRRHAKPMLDAARLLRGRFPRARFIIGRAPLIDEQDLAVPPGMREYVSVAERGDSMLPRAALAIAASGTATLQAALSGTPPVVVYRTSTPTYLLARALVRIPWIAMPNVLAAETIVPELIQGGASPERIAEAAAGILGGPDRYRDLSRRLIGLRSALERPGGIDALARIALEMAGGAPAAGLVDRFGVMSDPSRTDGGGA